MESTYIQIPEFILPQNRRRLLTNNIIDTAAEMESSYTTKNTTVVFNPPESMELCYDMQPFVEQAVGRLLHPVNCFGRRSVQQAILYPHKDRDLLDWTVSINLKGDMPWPLEVKVNGHWLKLSPHKNKAVLTPGRLLEHRKEPYLGVEDVTLLLHYSEAAETFNKKTFNTSTYITKKSPFTTNDLIQEKE